MAGKAKKLKEKSRKMKNFMSGDFIIFKYLSALKVLCKSEGTIFSALKSYMDFVKSKFIHFFSILSRLHNLSIRKTTSNKQDTEYFCAL